MFCSRINCTVYGKGCSVDTDDFLYAVHHIASPGMNLEAVYQMLFYWFKENMATLLGC